MAERKRARKVRFHDVLWKRIGVAARKAGKTPSEWLRDIAERRLDRQEEEDRVIASIEGLRRDLEARR